MGVNLVIVESPAKAKTIEKFLGSEYTVKSSFGHIRDLSKKNLGVDIEKGFEPDYLISDEKRKVVSELKKLAKKADMVWLASDEDREGEAIAWHLKEVLQLDNEKSKRIVFHEITKEAILHAIENPREIDMNLVMAQQARRVLDRIVGFEISPLLWRKVKPKLSAGRVQSVALRLIVEREREIHSATIGSFYRVEGLFFSKERGENYPVTAQISHRFKKEEEAVEVLERAKEALFKIESIEEKKSKRAPAPPFTTSTLQQEASRKLGFSLNQTMRSAQNLYEAGFITYMRTDSVNLSKLAIASAKETIVELYGAKYSKTRAYRSKTKGAQEAHEAIRPTYFSNKSVEGSPQDKRLYKLIWQRTLASQMADADIVRTQIAIATPKIDYPFIATAERVAFDGFLKLYMEGRDDEGEEELKALSLPELKSGEEMEYSSIRAVERFEQRAARYNEATLVKKLEELGIGRPSTYAPTISTIITRGYIVKESREGSKREYREITLIKGEISSKRKEENWGAEKSKLFPEDIGILVNDFLIEHFSSVFDYNFTAKIEESFDKVAEGKLVWNSMINKFYTPFHKQVEATLSESKPTNAERYLGIDPKSEKRVLARIGRFGPLVQIGEADDPEKRFMSLAKGQLIETITLPEALKLFELPRVVGELEGEEVIAAVGRYGPYLKYRGSFVSLGKELSPYSVTIAEAKGVIEEHAKREAQKIIKRFPDLDAEVLNGRYGPYIKRGKENFKIPKGVDPASIDESSLLEIIEKSGKAKGTKKRK